MTHSVLSSTERPATARGLILALRDRGEAVNFIGRSLLTTVKLEGRVRTCLNEDFSLETRDDESRTQKTWNRTRSRTTTRKRVDKKTKNVWMIFINHNSCWLSSSPSIGRFFWNSSSFYHRILQARPKFRPADILLTVALLSLTWRASADFRRHLL